jgi:tripartite-type tricarboxylate transporter receptor subunit TctC
MRGIRGLGVAAGIAATLLGASARAETDYPVRPIHVVVPYPAGGIVDIVARAVTEQVGRDLKTPIVIEARPGANSNIGTASVARSAADGYTWLSRDRRCWSIPRCTRTPAGTR